MSDLLGRLMFVREDSAVLTCSYVTMSADVFTTDILELIGVQFPSFLDRLSLWQGILIDAITGIGQGYANASASGVLAHVPTTLEEGTTIPLESTVLHGNDVEFYTTTREYKLSRIDMRIRPSIMIDLDIDSLDVIAVDVVTVYYVPRLRPSMIRPVIPGTTRQIPLNNGYVAEIPLAALVTWHLQGLQGDILSHWSTDNVGGFWSAYMDVSLVGILSPTVVYPNSFYHPDSVGHITPTTPLIVGGRIRYSIGQTTPYTAPNQFVPFSAGQPPSTGGYVRSFEAYYAYIRTSTYYLGQIPSQGGQEAAIIIRPGSSLIPRTTSPGLPIMEVIDIVTQAQQAGLRQWRF